MSGEYNNAFKNWSNLDFIFRFRFGLWMVSWFCTTGMAGSEDKPFIVGQGFAYSSDYSEREFRELEHIFQDCIERDHGYERSDASCFIYADEGTANNEEKKWIDFWEQKGRKIIKCEY